MAVWIARGGRKGQFEQQMLDHSVIVMAWETIPDLSAFRDRGTLREWYRGFFPDGLDAAVANYAGQLFAFVNTASIGDLVVVPFRNQIDVAIGEIIGDYAYRQILIVDAPHTRPVRWLRTGIPRNELAPDLRSALSARMTFSQSRRHDAERRFRQIASFPSVIRS